MELDREEWLGRVDNSFVGEIVGVDKEWLPISRERVVVNSEAMVLKSNKYQC
jgi:hypothetical protein